MIIREILLISFVSLALMSCSKENGLIKLRDNNSELLINSSDDFNSIQKLMVENEGDAIPIIIIIPCITLPILLLGEIRFKSYE